MSQGKWSVCFSGIALLAASMAAPAHELFMKPDRFFLKPNATETLTVVNGTFDQSLAIFARTRMADVSIASAGKIAKPPLTDWHDAASASHLTFSTGAAGTYVAGVASRSGVRPIPAADFRSFLQLYGALDGLAAFEADGRDTPVRQRSSKHVKAVVQVGNVTSADFAAVLGHPVEVVLATNPYAIQLGDELRFQVLADGKPVANHMVYASHAGFNEDDAAPKRLNALKLRTDKDGFASFRVSKRAPWYITLIHVQPAQDADADYVSTWATLSFEMR